MRAKVRALNNYRVAHEGEVWHIDGAIYIDFLRVFKVHGNINSPNLMEALQILADSYGLQRALMA